MHGPLLTGDPVTLRPPDEEDAARFVPWFADLRVTRYLGRRAAVALYQEEDFLLRMGTSATDVFWMIEAAGRPIGATGIHAIDWINAHATTGTVIGDVESWGKGYASAAMRIRTAYAFRQLNLHSLGTVAFADNAASRRALEKAGYRGIGVERERFFREGRWHDLWHAQILRADWEAAQAG